MTSGRCCTIASIIGATATLGAAAAAANTASPEFEPRTDLHTTQTAVVDAHESGFGDTGGQAEAAVTAPSTRSSFMATWQSVSGASGYLLDVSRSQSFSDYVDGYHDFDVRNVTGWVVTGLNHGTTYYYRVRPYYVGSRGSYSEVMSAATVPNTGLNIHATFDASIVVNQNAAAIEAMINRAIAIYESLFTDPITIEILFRYAPTGPNGDVLPNGVLSQSNSVVYNVSWSTFINALRADARTPNDSLANASLPSSAISPHIGVHSANGRAVRLNTAPAMFPNGTVANGGPYDGIVTLNSQLPFQFTRPVAGSNYDAQRATEHEINEVLAFASRADITNPRPQDLFSWSSGGHRNISEAGWRYFSVDGGVNRIVFFNQDQYGDRGDWAYPDGTRPCPDPRPHVQNAFGCTGQPSDITATSPEGINLDVIGYDLTNAPPFAPPATDFDNDGSPDFLLYNASTRQTWISGFYVPSEPGPTLPAGWSVMGVADFNRNGHPDYLLFNSVTHATVVWYMNNNVHVGGATGPMLPGGWTVAALADVNWDGYPDYVLFNANSRATVVWYMRNNAHIGSASGPTLPAGWALTGVADFNGDGHPDYSLSNPGTHGTVIWYMSGVTHVGSHAGPTIPQGYNMIGVADFDGNGRPDYVLYNPNTYRISVWYLNNYHLIGGANGGPVLDPDWAIVAP
jgi:hypothetical protein